MILPPLRPPFSLVLCTGEAIRHKHVPHPGAVTSSLLLSQDTANAINTACQLLLLSGDGAIFNNDYAFALLSILLTIASQSKDLLSISLPPNEIPLISVTH